MIFLQTIFIFFLAFYSLDNVAEPMHSLIIGGEEVHSLEDPVALSTVFIKGYLLRSSFKCSGVIIAPQIIITAAHCLGPGWAKTEIFLANGSGPFKGIKSLRHPNYNDKAKLNEPRFDIALIKLDQQIPAPFHAVELIGQNVKQEVGRQTLLAGYGQNVSEKNPNGDGGVGILRKVFQEILQPEFNPYELVINIRHKGSCFGDSGGPAYIVNVGVDNNRTQLFLAGITSRLTANDIVSAPNKKLNYACLNDMIYTNVNSLRDWIYASIDSLDKY